MLLVIFTYKLLNNAEKFSGRSYLFSTLLTSFCFSLKKVLSRVGLKIKDDKPVRLSLINHHTSAINSVASAESRQRCRTRQTIILIIINDSMKRSCTLSLY